MEQKIIEIIDKYDQIDEYLNSNGFKNVFIVCDNSLQFLKLNSYFNSLSERLGIKTIFFSDFVPNPFYESVARGVELFKDK